MSVENSSLVRSSIMTYLFYCIEDAKVDFVNRSFDRTRKHLGDALPTLRLPITWCALFGMQCLISLSSPIHLGALWLLLRSCEGRSCESKFQPKSDTLPRCIAYASLINLVFARLLWSSVNFNLVRVSNMTYLNNCFLFWNCEDRFCDSKFK